MSRRLELRVEARKCTRCGACSALCPSIFDVSAQACRMVRQPTPDEQLSAEAARWICPTGAIHASTEGADAGKVAVDGGAPQGKEEEAPLFDNLLATAETVRWGLASIPWSDLDPALAPAELRLVVREMAFSESATYSATQRFLDAFSDDVDFSRWIAVWFYEETRHPYVLMEWLRLTGEPLHADFVLKGRVSTPFMRSTVGTLVTNVVSEMTASHAYRYLARTAPEPVLRRLASLIAGDEARHAASFFRFARQRLSGMGPAASLRERVRALEVLHAWLDARSVTHPVQQMIERLGAARTGTSFEVDFGAIRVPVVRVVGLLLDRPLYRTEDVVPALRELLAHRRG